MYRFFYNHEVSGDILFIVIRPDLATTSHQSVSNVTAIYHDDVLTGLNIFDISKSIKIHSVGMIESLRKEFIEAVNAILEGAKMAPLPISESSGFVIGKITKMEEHPVDEKAHIVTISLGDKEYTTVSHYKNLSEGAFVVVEIDGCIGFDGSIFHEFTSRNILSEVSICSPHELKMDDDGSGAYLLNEGKPGSDFFLAE